MEQIFKGIRCKSNIHFPFKQVSFRNILIQANINVYLFDYMSYIDQLKDVL